MVSDYTAEGMLIGHLVRRRGADRRAAAESLARGRKLLMMIKHMILSHHDLPEYGSPKPPMFPEAEALHTLDLLDARMFEMNARAEERAARRLHGAHLVARTAPLSPKGRRRAGSGGLTLQYSRFCCTLDLDKRANAYAGG